MSHVNTDGDRKIDLSTGSTGTALPILSVFLFLGELAKAVSQIGGGAVTVSVIAVVAAAAADSLDKTHWPTLQHVSAP